MKRSFSVRNIAVCGVCIALCYILPLALHPFGLGTALSPMHIPVLLCGLVCGGGYGLVCGIAGPILSYLLSGMPAPPYLFTMIPELAVYGLASGLLMKLVRTRFTIADLYISLLSAMVLGRIVGGVVKVLFYTGGQAYGLSMWVSAYFISTLPGIICHIILLPLLYLTLSKAKLIPCRYPKGATHG